MILDQYLQNIGLSDKEAQLYLVGLQLGPATIQQLSQQSGIKRSTVYEVIDSLKEQNLFFVTQKGKRKLFTAQDPDNLSLLLQQKQKILTQIMPDLEALKNTTAIKPAIRVYEGLDGLKQIYEDMIKKPGDILAMAAPKEKISTMLLDYLIHEWEPRRIGSDINMRRININNKQDPSLDYQALAIPHELEQIKYLPPEAYPFSVGVYVYRQKVAFVAYDDREMVGIVVRSPQINATIRAVFELLWNLAK
jgi:DNA-binding transcriptional regulator GbsR (MarR family)